MNLHYDGEGSIDDPKFPLKYYHPSGAITICHNRDDLIECMERDSEAEARMWKFSLIVGTVAAIIGLAILSI